MKEITIEGKKIQCKHPWPNDCYCQGGSKGLVMKKGAFQKIMKEGKFEKFSENVSYTTAFFEAFPTTPSTFIRGEGKTIEEAENKAWEKYSRYTACDHLEWERRDYKNGAGFCKKCGMFSSDKFKPLTQCVICDTPTNYISDKNNNFYCQDHEDKIPEENLTELQKHSRDFLKRTCNEN